MVMCVWWCVYGGVCGGGVCGGGVCVVVCVRRCGGDVCVVVCVW